MNAASMHEMNRELNKAFQRLIYLLSDKNRVAVFIEHQQILFKTSGKNCLAVAEQVLTER